VMSAASIIALMMEAARTSETLVDICLTTRQNIPEDCELLSIHVVRERQGTAERRWVYITQEICNQVAEVGACSYTHAPFNNTATVLILIACVSKILQEWEELTLFILSLPFNACMASGGTALLYLYHRILLIHVSNVSYRSS
jgi:hypothetical protein